MTPEAQRIAIAEFCGLKFPYGIQFNDKGAAFDMHGSHAYCPDYPNNLNAMHEAEMLLETRTPIRAYGYVLELEAAILRAANLKPNGHVGDYRKITATAAQRAEALLRTIGKWQTEKEPTNKK
jgi:hypothetical protein